MKSVRVTASVLSAHRPEKYGTPSLGAHLGVPVPGEVRLAVFEPVIQVDQERADPLSSAILKIYTGLRIFTARIVMSLVIRPGLVSDDL
jgi:hypothetical protein